MFRYFLLAAIVYATVETAQADDSYSYNFKLPQLSAGMVSNMKDKMKFKILDTFKKMESECKYMKSCYEYAFTVDADQAIGGYCSTDEDVEKLDQYTQTFKTSFTECFDELNCTTSFDNTASEVVAEIQALDQSTKTEADACSGDKTCESQAYKSMHDSLRQIYVDKIPTLRYEEDQVKATAIADIVSCIIPKVETSFKTMVQDTARMQACLTLGPPEAKGDHDEDSKAETEVVESETTNSEDNTDKTE